MDWKRILRSVFGQNFSSLLFFLTKRPKDMIREVLTHRRVSPIVLKKRVIGS